MKRILGGMITIFLFLGCFPAISFSQNQTVANLDLNSNISDIAYDLADYHYQLAKAERLKGNVSGAEKHENLAMMTLDEISAMVRGTLDEGNKSKIMSAGAGNCIITYNSKVLCLN